MVRLECRVHSCPNIALDALTYTELSFHGHLEYRNLRCENPVAITADEITDYFLQNAQSSLTTPNTPSLCQAIIESWICMDAGNHVVIRGQIHNHPKYPSGTQLRTSPIQGYFCNGGRMYVNTNNSMYELGMPTKTL